MNKYPHTKINNITEIIHGVKITDEYQWLENSSDPNVQKWINIQNIFNYKEG